MKRLLLAIALLVCTPAAAARAAAITFSTYLGGSSDEAYDWFAGVVAVAVDDLGNRYVTGATRSPDFPTTEGLGRTLSGDVDIFVTKIAPGGTILYSTYLGGPCEDAAVDIAVDAAGSAYVTGRVHGGVCLEPVNAGALVAKLGPAGTLVYATALGGSLADTSTGQAIAVDAAGRAHVAGVASSSSHDFPTTPARSARRTAPAGGRPAATGSSRGSAPTAARSSTPRSCAAPRTSRRTASRSMRPAAHTSRAAPSRRISPRSPPSRLPRRAVPRPSRAS